MDYRVSRNKRTKQSKETAELSYSTLNPQLNSKHLYCTGWQENEGKCKKAYNYCMVHIASDNSSPTDTYLKKVDNLLMYKFENLCLSI